MPPVAAPRRHRCHTKSFVQIDLRLGAHCSTRLTVTYFLTRWINSPTQSTKLNKATGNEPEIPTTDVMRTNINAGPNSPETFIRDPHWRQRNPRWGAPINVVIGSFVLHLGHCTWAIASLLRLRFSWLRRLARPAVKPAGTTR